MIEKILAGRILTGDRWEVLAETFKYQHSALTLISRLVSSTSIPRSKFAHG
jgi:hypothetical protein